jgi:8-oxo-dGTP pyrophosphatase MutT (NUDIX family)
MKSINQYISLSNERISSIDNYISVLNERISSIDDYILEAHKNIQYVDAILVSPDDEILILQRANYMKKFPSKWGLVGGHVDDKDKDNRSAIKREIKEETGYELTWNEEHEAKVFEKITHEDGSSTEYWIIKLETKPEIKISREHRKFIWFSEESKTVYKFIPDVFQIIQKYYNL